MNVSLGASSPESRQKIAYYAAAVVTALLFCAAGYFIYVRPATSEAALLSTRVTNLQAESRTAQSNYDTASQLSKVQLADLFDLTRAMPDNLQMADILVVLGRIAHNSGVEFQSITPTALIPLAGYQAAPMQITLKGSFYDLMEFLYEVRHLVDVRQESTSGAAKLFATGRLFAVNKIAISLAKSGDPNQPPLTATVDLDAFIYGTAAPATPVTPAVTDTTSTTTTAGTASAAAAPTGGSN